MVNNHYYFPNCSDIRRFLRRQFQYSIIFVLLLSIQLLPRGWSLSLCRVLADLAWKILPGERRKVLFNLRLIFPQRCDHEILGREIFRAMAENAVDAIRLPRLSAGEIEGLVEVSGLKHFDRAYRRGNGIVAVTGHIGCWELIPAWFAQRGYRIGVIGKRVYDPRLDRLLNRARSKWGIQVIDRDRGAKEALRALHRGQALGILIDQDTRVASVEVLFMGHPAKTPTGAAMLARKTGAAVVPLAVHRLANGRHRITILPELIPSPSRDRWQQTLDDVQQQTKAIEELIELDIRQWAWMHLRWVRKPGEGDLSSESIKPG